MKDRYCSICGQWPTHKGGCPNQPDFRPTHGEYRHKLSNKDKRIEELEKQLIYAVRIIELGIRMGKFDDSKELTQSYLDNMKKELYNV